MRLGARLILALLLIPPMLARLAMAQPTSAPAKELSPAEIFQRVSPAVCQIDILDEDDKVIGHGSGFVISLPGTKNQRGEPPFTELLVTNYHVIRNAVDAKLHFGDSQDSPTSFVGLVFAEDPEVDLAILFVHIHSGKRPSTVTLAPSPESALDAALALLESSNKPTSQPASASQPVTRSLAEWEAMAGREMSLEEAMSLPPVSPQPRVGDKIYVIGSPQGLTNTLSEGLISGFRKTKDGEWIQITAPISSGSSGGPVLNTAGEVIGVTTAFLSEGQNLNFAVPVSQVHRLRESKYPKLRYIWEGVSVRKAEEHAYYDLTWINSPVIKRFQQLHPGEYVYAHSGGLTPECKQWILSNKATDQRSLLTKGYLQYLDKDYPAARETLKQAVDAPMADGETPNLTYLSYFTLGRVHCEVEFEYAKKHVRFSDDRGFTEFTEKSVFDNTVAALKQARQTNPDFAPAYYRLAYCYRDTKQYPQALVEAEFLVRLVPRCYLAYVLRAGIRSNLDQYEEALEDCRTALELRPNFWLASNNIGVACFELGRHREAIQAFEAVVAMNPGPVFEGRALGSIAKVYLHLGNLQQAITVSEKAIKVLQQHEEGPLRENLIREQRTRIAECRRRLGQE